MVAFWWAFSVISYIAGATWWAKKIAWWLVDDSSYTSKPSELDGAAWLLVGFGAATWAFLTPFYIMGKTAMLAFKCLHLNAWFDCRPVPLSERKALRKQERLDRLNTDIKNAEKELDKVTSLVHSLQSDPANFNASDYKYGIPGHRSW